MTLPASCISPGVAGGYLHTKAVNGWQGMMSPVGAQTSRLGIVSNLVTCCFPALATTEISVTRESDPALAQFSNA